jgi:hypothetical protein
LKEFVELERNDVKKEGSTSNDNSRWMYFDYKYMNEWFSDQSGLLNVSPLSHIQEISSWSPNFLIESEDFAVLTQKHLI